MRIRILGCSGGFAKGFHTTAALIDDDLLLDVGTGIGELSCESMSGIKNVLLSHSHLDHVAGVCFLVDNALENFKKATGIHCLEHTATMIRQNLINGELWPDIEEIKIKGTNLLEISEITPYETIDVEGKRVTPLPVDHVVPTVGYALHGPRSMFVYVSDMIDAEDRFWDWINKQDNISHIVVECSFPSGMEKIAELSKHLTPKLLKDRLKKIRIKRPRPQILVSHLKPNYSEDIRRELREKFPDGEVVPLEAGMEFEF